MVEEIGNNQEIEAALEKFEDSNAPLPSDSVVQKRNRFIDLILKTGVVKTEYQAEIVLATLASLVILLSIFATIKALLSFQTPKLEPEDQKKIEEKIKNIENKLDPANLQISFSN